MTSNQISYWRYQEEKRHNLAEETEKHRANVRSESLQGEANQTARLRQIEDANQNVRSNILKQSEIDVKEREAKAKEKSAKADADRVQNDLQRLIWQKFVDQKSLMIAQEQLAVSALGAMSNILGAAGKLAAAAGFGK